MKNIYYTCPFVPGELIAACGLRPCRVSPSLEVDGRLEGMCSFAGAFLEFLDKRAGNEAAIFTTSCDQMRRGFELSTCLSSFLLNVPTMTSIRAFSYYLDELTRLQNFLCGISGQMPDWDRIKNSKSDSMPDKKAAGKGVKISVTGGPVNEQILNAINDLIEAKGGSISFNATENALQPDGLDKFIESDDMLEEIAQAYFEMPTIWRRPNNMFFEWLVRHIRKKEADGIILLRNSFCDLWRCTGQELAKQASLPVLELDLDGKGELSTWAVSRIEAFIEGRLR